MGQGVKQEIVFKAFRAKGISFAPSPNQKKYYFEVAIDGRMSTEYIPPELGRKGPIRFHQLYGIPLEWFYMPLSIPGEEDKKAPN
jgi:hypothetical protein